MILKKEIHISIKVILPKSIGDKIWKLQKKSGLFYNPDKESYPHITIYASRFPKDAFTPLCKRLRSLKLQSFQSRIGKIKTRKEKINEKPFLYFDVENPAKFYALHVVILNTANSFRRGLIGGLDLQRVRNGKYSNREKLYVNKYGTNRALKNFLPHITLGKRDKSEISGIKKVFKLFEKSPFKVEGMVVKSKLVEYKSADYKIRESKVLYETKIDF